MEVVAGAVVVCSFSTDGASTLGDSPSPARKSTLKHLFKEADKNRQTSEDLKRISRGYRHLERCPLLWFRVLSPLTFAGIKHLLKDRRISDGKQGCNVYAFVLTLMVLFVCAVQFQEAGPKDMSSL